MISLKRICFSLYVTIARICSLACKNLSILHLRCPKLLRIYIEVEETSLRLANVSSDLKAKSFADFTEFISLCPQLLIFQMFEVLLFLPQGALVSKGKITERFCYWIDQFQSITFFDCQHQLSVGLSFKKLYSSGKFSDKLEIKSE